MLAFGETLAHLTYLQNRPDAEKPGQRRNLLLRAAVDAVVTLSSVLLIHLTQ